MMSPSLNVMPVCLVRLEMTDDIPTLIRCFACAEQGDFHLMKFKDAYPVRLLGFRPIRQVTASGTPAFKLTPEDNYLCEGCYKEVVGGKDVN